MSKEIKVKQLDSIFAQDSIVRLGADSNLFSKSEQIEVYEKGGEKLLLLTPTSGQDPESKITHIQLFDERYKTEKGIHFGVVGNKRKILWHQKNSELNQANEIMDILKAKPSELKKFNLPFTRTGKPRKPKEILSSGEYLIKDLFELWPDLKKIPNKLHSQLETDCRYNVYLKRQQEDINAYQKENNINIPTNFDFNEIKGLSNEIKDILKNIKPNTIAQAAKLPGFTPTATLLLLRYLKKQQKDKVFSEY